MRYSTVYSTSLQLPSFPIIIITTLSHYEYQRKPFFYLQNSVTVTITVWYSGLALEGTLRPFRVLCPSVSWTYALQAYLQVCQRVDVSLLIYYFNIMTHFYPSDDGNLSLYRHLFRRWRQLSVPAEQGSHLRGYSVLLAVCRCGQNTSCQSNLVMPASRLPSTGRNSFLFIILSSSFFFTEDQSITSTYRGALTSRLTNNVIPLHFPHLNLLKYRVKTSWTGMLRDVIFKRHSGSH